MNSTIIIRFPIVLQTLIMPNNLCIPKCSPRSVLTKSFIQAFYHVQLYLGSTNVYLALQFVKLNFFVVALRQGIFQKVPFIYQKQINAKASYETTAALFTQSTCCHSTTREHRHVVYKTASEPRENKNIKGARLL